MKQTILAALFCLLALHFSLAQDLSSGLPIGSDCPAFDPHHVSGPDRNTTACPMCKYGSRQGFMLWVNDADWQALEPILLQIEKEIRLRGLRKFRVFVMYMNPEQKSLSEAIRQASEVASRLKLRNVALTVVPSANDPETAGLFQINPDERVKSTVLVYSRRKVVYKSVNITQADLNSLFRKCDELFASDPL